MNPQIVLRPCLRVEGSIQVPGDKSISHRALIVGAFGEGEMEIAGLSSSADVSSSRAAIEALGVQTLDSHVNVQSSEASPTTLDFQVLLNSPGVRRWRSPSGPIDVGNSGTTIRLLLGALAGSAAAAELTGDDSIRRRPMGRVVKPLQEMGAEIAGIQGGEYAPLQVTGGLLSGRAHVLPVASAQVKSALLLAGLLAAGETSVIEPAPSRDHTERLLRYLGVQVVSSRNQLSVKSTNIQNASVTIPGDISSAAFLLVAAALLPGSEIAVEKVGVNPTRTGILDILRSFGARVEISDLEDESGEPRGTVRIRAGDRRPLDVSGDLVVAALDELPLIAILGSVAEGETVVQDATELRVKESDRIAAIVGGLTRMGADIEGTPDGFVVRGPRKLRGATVDAAGDHRIAMALAVAALTAEGETTITGWDSVGISYAGFERDLEHLVVR
jgi:3-phosphoshikimate 1-carboxyvinyltransferase